MPWDAVTDSLGWAEIEVKTLDGWASPDRCFRFGDLIRREDLEHADEQHRPYLRSWMVDEDFHRHDAGLLKELNVGMSPPADWDRVWSVPPETDPHAQHWMQAWSTEWRSAYHRHLDHRPGLGYLRPDGFHMPVGWELLILAGESAQSRVSRWLLDQCLSAPPGFLHPATFRHSTQTRWPEKSYPHPLWSLMLSHGRLEVSGEDVDFASLLISDISARGADLPTLADLLPGLAPLQTAAGEFQSRRASEEIWKDWFAMAARESIDAGTLADLYEEAGRAGLVPDAVCSPDGPLPLSDVLIGRHSRDVLQAAEAGRTCIRLSGEVGALWVRQGADLA
jgi:hypothetical protein